MTDPAPPVEADAGTRDRRRSAAARLLFAIITLGSWILLVAVVTWVLPRMLAFWGDFEFELPALTVLLINHWTLLASSLTVLLLALLIVGEVVAGAPTAAWALRVLALVLVLGFAAVVILAIFAPMPKVMMSVT